MTTEQKNAYIALLQSSILNKTQPESISLSEISALFLNLLNLLNDSKVETTSLQQAVLNVLDSDQFQILNGKIHFNDSEVNYVLTLNVTGLPDTYEIAVNDVVWINHSKSFPSGTILTDLTPTIEGYTLNPISVDSVIMDADKTLNFTAVPNGDSIVLSGNKTDGGNFTFINGDTTVNGTTVTALNGSSSVITDYYLKDGDEGEVSAILDIAGVAFSATSDSYDGHNQTLAGMSKNPVYKIQAYSNGDGTNTETGNLLQTTSSKMVISKTVGQTPGLIKFYYESQQDPWAQCLRPDGDMYLKGFIEQEGGTIKMLTVKGFTRI